MFEFKNNIVRRFKVLFLLIFIIWGGVIIYDMIVIATAERDFWKNVEAHARKNKELPIRSKRGNIISDKGEIIVTDLPRYNIYIDFLCVDKNNPKQADKINEKRDSLWRFIPDSVYDALCEIFPDKSPDYFENHILAGLKKKSRYHRFYPRPLSYSEYKRVMKLPMFTRSTRISGVIADNDIERKNLFGNTMQSTLGDSRKSDGKVVTYGLERKFNDYLKGEDGVKRQVKEMGVVSYKTLKPSKDGMNIQTTIDMELQDLCEKAMKDPVTGLPSFGAQAGWLILMEVKTGDIKAVVNLAEEYGTYRYLEKYNYNNPKDVIKYCDVENFAFTASMEPGSVFKTIALAAALEEGSISPESTVPMPQGQDYIVKYRKDYRDDGYLRREQKDRYGIVDALKYSSNMAMVQFIDGAYSKRPQVYIDNVRKLGVLENYNLLDCEATPYMTQPKEKNLWGKTTLCSQSFGYAVRVPAINLVTFYAGLANKGVQMRPRLVKAVFKGDTLVEEYPTEVLNPKMLKPSTVDILHKGLVAVVGENKPGVTGRNVKSDKVQIAGKTGTAIMETKNRLFSFCGYFPADAPEYACIIQAIRYERPDNEKSPRSYGGAGRTSGLIFKSIAESVMAIKEYSTLEAARDTIRSIYPKVKKGNIDDANYVLKELNQQVETSGEEQMWGKINYDENGDVDMVDCKIVDGVVPNVIGMGAKDAVYLMEQAGLKVEIYGYGKVKSQNIAEGVVVSDSETVTLILEP